MKPLEKMAVVWVALYALMLALAPLAGYVLPEWLGLEYSLEWNATPAFANTARLLLMAPVQIAVGVWLFAAARKAGASPWVWLVFGLLFGVVAAVLFYVWRLYEKAEAPGKQDRPVAAPSD
ncbi:MAG: hypothetical protein R6X20_06085 [Phycisphaerae bacterium]